MNTSFDLSSDFASVVLAAVAQLRSPATLTEVKKNLTGPFKVDAALQQCIGKLVSEGKLHVWPGTGKSVKYWAHERTAYLAQQVIELVTGGPLSTAQVVAKLKPLVSNAKSLDPILTDLEKAGQIFRYPPASGAVWRWSSVAPEPKQLLKKTLKAFADEKKALEKKGITTTQVRQAAFMYFADHGSPLPSTPLMQRLYRIMQLASSGGTVPLRELRRLTFIDKSNFDHAVLQLREEKYIHLHRHDAPMMTDNEEREEMVTDGHDNYYIAAGVLQGRG